PLAQLDAPDLAADGLRQALHELDLARILVGRRDPLHVLLQLVHQRLARRPIARQHDERLDDLAADRIRAGHDGRLDDGRMLEQRALYLEWPDAIARRDDDVVGPADEPEVAILVASGAVSGQVPFATPAGCGLLRALPVLAEERRRVPAQRQVAHL